MTITLTAKLKLLPTPEQFAALRATQLAYRDALNQVSKYAFAHGKTSSRRRLQQVLMNLLNNAIEYAPQSERIEVRLNRLDGRAVLEVADYGPGIAESDLPQLFSQYYQAARWGDHRTGGLGLGLFLTPQLVMAHNGAISVVSSTGAGTCFTISLPLETAGSEQTAAD